MDSFHFEIPVRTSPVWVPVLESMAVGGAGMGRAAKDAGVPVDVPGPGCGGRFRRPEEYNDYTRCSPA